MKKNVRDPVPVIVLTGFLGSGKSTIVNRLVKERPGRKFGVLLNEFGTAALESQIVETRKKPVVELPAGCLCCAGDGEIEKALKDLLKKDSALELLIIEASGLTSPAPVLELLSREDNPDFRLSAVWAIIDASTFLDREKEVGLVRKQLSFADVVLLTKTDMTPVETRLAVENRLAALKPGIAVFPTSERIPWDAMGEGGERLVGPSEGRSASGKRFFRADQHHEVKVWEFEYDRPLKPEAVKAAFAVEEPGLLRTKGILYLDDPTGQRWKYLVQVAGAQKQLYSRPWDANEPRRTSLVFLGTAFDEGRLERMLKAGTESPVGIESPVGTP